MNLDDQLIFLFSALGGVNGLFLSIYFAFFIKKRNDTTYLLSALLFVISIRVTKSAFFHFYGGLSSSFIQLGLTACLLIGPFLYLHVRSITDKKYASWNWIVHVFPIIIAMIIIGYTYPYQEHRHLWHRNSGGVLGWFMYIQWFMYLMSTSYLAKNSFKKLFSKKLTSSNQDIWLVNVVSGIWIVFLAYYSNGYTSYIVGALSFSFIFYISVLLWVSRKGKIATFFESPEKYASKTIAPLESDSIASKLEQLFEEQELYKNPDLKLSEVANEMNLVSNYLSQFLNDNLNKSFSNFVNEYRVRAAEEMLMNNDILTVEAIGNECGFKSNSTFYAAFKRVKGVTPGEFKKKIT
ncbi:MAG: helix-turn-helix domain-containing protein [Balneola sp.]|jgi:AraC-like DNA-binding protein